MLVLTRKSEEAIQLGDNITITIVEIKGNKVRVGIDAPEVVRIYRKELYDKIKSENILSSAISIGDFDKIKDAFQN